MRQLYKHPVQVILILLFFASCFSQKQAAKYIGKADVVYPDLTAQFCANRFPVKESTNTEIKYIPGRIDTLTNYIELDCDTVIEPKYIERKIKVEVPKVIYRTDTIEKEKTKIVENTALSENLRRNFVTKSTELDKQLKKNRSLYKWIYGLSITFLILLVLLIVKSRLL